MPILVTGATGNAGRAVLDAALARGLPVRAALRDAAADLPAAAERVRFDLTRSATWDPALEGARGVFLVIPPGLGAGPLLAFLARARLRGAGPFVYLSVQGAESSRVVPHRKVEDALRAGPADWTILRPGFFAQNLGGPYRRDIREDGRLYLPAGEARVAFLDVRDAGEVAALAFADPDAHRGRACTLTGAEAPTFHEVARVLTEETGRPVRYEPATLAGYLRHLRRRGTPWTQALVYARLHLGLRWGEGNRPTLDLPRLLGRPPRTIRDYVRDHRALWT